MWYIVLLVSFIMIICSFAVASKVEERGDIGFTAIWSLLMVLATAFGGTLVFRRYQTEGAIGFLIGVTAMMGQMFITIFIVFMDYKNLPDVNSEAVQSESAFAAFSFILFVTYTLTAISLYWFRGDLLPINEPAQAAGGPKAAGNAGQPAPLPSSIAKAPAAPVVSV